MKKVTFKCQRILKQFWQAVINYLSMKEIYKVILLRCYSSNSQAGNTPMKKRKPITAASLLKTSNKLKSFNLTQT